MNLFAYPKGKHRRRLNPGPFSGYGRFKPFLREEFSRQCVYCRLPDSLKGEASFGVDHYKPKSLAPELETEYSNLFYACNCCNRRKWHFWPSDEQKDRGEFVPNPCSHSMFEHLRYKAALVVPRSRTGDFTVDLLQLNDDTSLEYRQHVLGLIEICRETIKELSDALAQSQGQLSASEETVLESKRATISRHLKFLSGGSTGD